MALTESFADGDLETSVDSHIGQLTINRPARKNAVTAAMWSAIPAAMVWLVKNDARAILITGAGKTDFCAGADIDEFATHRKDAQTSQRYEELNVQAFHAIRTAQVPVISVIRGICYGGGFGIAAASDIRIADHSARFAIPAAKLGLAYPVEAMQDIVSALGPQMAKAALFTAQEMTASEIAAAGGVLPLVEPPLLNDAARSIAEQIVRNAPLSIRASKLAVNAVMTQDQRMLADAKSLGEFTFTSRDYAEGRAAFKDRRKPHFTGE